MEKSYLKIIEDKSENQAPTQETPPVSNEISKESKREIKKMAVNLNNYEKGAKLGEGSFGKVYKITEKETGKIYCAKISKKVIEDNTFEDLLNLLTEVSLFSKFDHPSIVQFIGYSTINFNNEPKPVIIMEYSPNGSLQQAIKLEYYSRAISEWDDTHKLINIYGLASAMAYLHRHNILHRDLKTENILLDDYLFPKVSDFGLSTISSSESTQSMIFDHGSNFVCGTPIYMSPEIIKEHKYTKAGDVYSFSLIVYEIMTMTAPFNELHSFIEIIKKVVFDKERPKIDQNVPSSYRNLIEKCWQEDPNKRPSFDEIVNLLETDPGFILDSVDQDDFFNYVDYVKNYQSKFDDSKPQIPVRFKVCNSKDSQLTEDLNKSGINNEFDLYSFIGQQNMGFTMIGGKKNLFEDYKQKAENGNAFACYKCGEMLYSGDKVDQNKELAAFYYKKAADNGNNEGALKYATMLYKGDGIQSNFEEALHYYKILADNPDSNGNQIYKYAKFLLNKNCTAFNAVEGLKYLEKAADLCSEKAALRLGNILYNGEFGVKVDKVKASQFYEIAADKNNAIAMCNLGLMLMNGDGIEMNKESALSLFADAANQNNLTGIDNYLKLLNEGVQEK